jgi:dihydroneopterin aldolase
VPTDRIVLRGIRAWAHHGVLAHEADLGQEFLVDVALHVDLRAPGDSDDLADTVDYGAVATLVHDRVTGPRHDLVEAVAADVAAAVLAHDDRIDAVDVTIHKPAAPVSVALDDVEVHVHRRRTSPS